MKFIGGFIVGVITTIVVAVLFAANGSSDGLDGLNMFDEKGECLTTSQLKVFQTMDENRALAEFGEYPDDQMVLLINHEGISYYDNQKVKVPADKCARHVGTFSYETKIGMPKTVPIVIIE